MKVIIDRIEGTMAVVELPDGSYADLPSVLVPEAQDGDILEIRVLEEETRQRREQMQARRNRLLKRKE